MSKRQEEEQEVGVKMKEQMADMGNSLPGAKETVNMAIVDCCTVQCTMYSAV